MNRARRPLSRTARAAAALTALMCLVLATTAGLALARSKSCTKISNCATRVTAVPPPQATLGGPPPATGHFAVAVKTPPTTTATVGQQQGTLIAKPVPTEPIKCPGYQFIDPTPLNFQLKTAAPVKITYEITDRLTNTTPRQVHFCLAASFDFRTLSGHRAPAAKLPDGTRGHIGLLPNCRRPLPPAGAATAPCVESTATIPDSTSKTHVDVILKARVPVVTAGSASSQTGQTNPTGPTGDPWGGA